MSDGLSWVTLSLFLSISLSHSLSLSLSHSLSLSLREYESIDDI